MKKVLVLISIGKHNYMFINKEILWIKKHLIISLKSFY